MMMFVSIVKKRAIGPMNVKTKRKKEEEDLDQTQEEEDQDPTQEEDLDQDLVRAEADHQAALAQEAAVEAINHDLRA